MAAKKRRKKARRTAGKKRSKRAAKKGGPLSKMGWPIVNFHPKTGKALPPRTAMNPMSGKLYPDTVAGYKRAAADFNQHRD